MRTLIPYNRATTTRASGKTDKKWSTARLLPWKNPWNYESTWGLLCCFVDRFRHMIVMLRNILTLPDFLYTTFCCSGSAQSSTKTNRWTNSVRILVKTIALCLDKKPKPKKQCTYLPFSPKNLKSFSWGGVKASAHFFFMSTSP